MDTSIHQTCLTEAELAIDGGAHLDSANSSFKHGIFYTISDVILAVVSSMASCTRKGVAWKLEETRFSLSEQEPRHVDGGIRLITVGLIATPYSWEPSLVPLITLANEATVTLFIISLNSTKNPSF